MLNLDKINIKSYNTEWQKQLLEIQVNTSNPTGESILQAVLRKKLKQIAEDADSLQGTAKKIMHMTEEALVKGGVVAIQAQMTFMTGAHARMMKDLGVIEFLQNQGVVLKKAPPTR